MCAIPKKDTELKTIAELTDRINSIERQRERLCSVLSPKDFSKHQAKIAKLTHRQDVLWGRRAQILKAGA